MNITSQTINYSRCLSKRNHDQDDVWIVLKTFARKVSIIDFFSETFIPVRSWVSYVRNAKKGGVTDFVLKRTSPEEHPKSEKIEVR